MNVKNANFVYLADGGVDFAIVEFHDGSKAKITDREELKRISEQMNQKNRQILMEHKIG